MSNSANPIEETPPKSKLWTYTFVVATLSNFTNCIAYWALGTQGVDYAMTEYGAGYSIASLVMPAMTAAAVFCRFFLGGKTDEWGIRRTMQFGALISAIAVVLYLVQWDMISFLVSRVIHGFGFAFVTSGLASFVSVTLPADRRAEGMGFFTIGNALGSGVGPLVSQLCFDVFNGYTGMFVLCTITSFAVLGLVLTIKRDPRTDPLPLEVRQAQEAAARKKSAGKKGGSLMVMASRMFFLPGIPLCLVMVLVFAGYSSVVAYAVIYADGIGATSVASLYFGVYSGTLVFARPIFGTLMDKVGTKPVVWMSFISYLIAFVLIIFAQNSAMYLASAFFMSLGVGVSQTNLQTILISFSPVTQMGKANNTFLLALDLGGGMMPMLYGVMLEFISLQAVYVVAFFLGIAAIALYVLKAQHIPEVEEDLPLEAAQESA